jgi:nitroreductase
MDLKSLLIDRFGLDLKLAYAEPVPPPIAQILQRRTHRRYAARPVADELIDLLIAAALSASAKSDFQQASIIKLKDPDKRKAIAVRFSSMPWIGSAPAFLVFCADARRLERIGAMRNHPRRNGDLEAFFNAAVDAALALQTFILAAEATGLGCCPISVIRNEMATVARELALPDGVFPVAGLCIGYPAGQGYISMRLPPAVTVHTDVYEDGDLEQQIDGYDRRRAARHMTPREQQRSPEKFGYADFYGWSEDKARQAAEPEGASFAAFVRAHGFLFE